MVDTAPCSWDIDASICCTDWDSYSAELQQQAIDYASLIMWAATARQYGLCDMVVRPCGPTNDCDSSGWYYDTGGATWVPYIWNGTWRNCWCGSSWCSCDPTCQVYLPGPVNSITEVRVGGATISASGYFVLDNTWLIRVDTDECWPLCADQNLAPGDEDAFQVSYVRGKTPPTALLNAAGSIACEYAKACLGLPCRLPGRVASIARQGVSVNMVDVSELLTNGLTGIWEVDQVIRSINPKGLAGPTRFYSPDLQVPRQVTWP